MSHKMRLFERQVRGVEMSEFKKTHHGYNEFAKSSFSELVSVTGPGKFLFLSGIGAEDESDPAGAALFPGDMAAQCSYAFDKARRLLARHGASMSDIVKITAYLTDIRDRPAYQKCRAEVFSGAPALPAHTLLVVSNLARPGMLVEIDIIAAVPA
jgi:2-iminobutanoate/2-iminopropanoate deaminase